MCVYIYIYIYAGPLVVAEEHERAPLLLAGAEEVALGAGDEADAVL